MKNTVETRAVLLQLLQVAKDGQRIATGKIHGDTLLGHDCLKHRAQRVRRDLDVEEMQASDLVAAPVLQLGYALRLAHKRVESFLRRHAQPVVHTVEKHAPVHLLNVVELSRQEPVDVGQACFAALHGQAFALRHALHVLRHGGELRTPLPLWHRLRASVHPFSSEPVLSFSLRDPADRPRRQTPEKKGAPKTETPPEKRGSENRDPRPKKRGLGFRKRRPPGP